MPIMNSSFISSTRALDGDKTAKLFKHNGNITVDEFELDGDITVDEFMQWLRRFDTVRHGSISRNELRRAIRGSFSSRKSRRGIKQRDSDGDGYIDEDEIDNLVKFAQKRLGLKMAAY